MISIMYFLLYVMTSININLTVYSLCSSIMFLVSKTLIALLMESANAEASDSSLEVIVPLESDLTRGNSYEESSK